MRRFGAKMALTANRSPRAARGGSYVVQGGLAAGV